MNKEQLDLKNALRNKNMNHPEAIIIYAKSGEKARMVGARKQADKWVYSKWTEMMESDLNGFLQVFLEANYTVIDVRAQANLATPGMGDATPILIVRPDVDIKQASLASVQLHQALVAAAKD